MLSKFKFFSFGFILFIGTAALCVSYVLWAFSPLDKEIAHAEEMKGRILYVKNQPQQAFPHFLAAAEIDDVSRRRSMRYQWAAETCGNLVDQIYYLRIAYSLNSEDDYFVDQLKEAPLFNALVINGQDKIDLSQEEWRKEAVEMWPDSVEEIIEMYSESPEDEESENQELGGLQSEAQEAEESHE
ncbi:hypothetical protein [Maridesulfovibrio frigidus]|uniref:hypothetical protein n=1 Tax=Maridesulfovibrio frigidus TaxID=340956 RepID=UPI0004E24C92|nr:hypothetical protein [Maridesulfovibrio frigidus]